MASTSKQGRAVAATRPTRASVSFPPDIYETLERIAQQRKVSVAWIVRDAVERYIQQQWPLLELNQR